MDKHDCIRFVRENPLCSLATIDKNNQPRVRMIGIWFADESGYYFQTSTFKEIPEQLKTNPHTELCFYKHEGMIGSMLRISGKVEFLDDSSMREKVLADRPFLKMMGMDKDSPALSLFRIAHGEAHFWTMESNLKPKALISF